MYSWSWVYASTYMGILFLMFGQYLPNTIVSTEGGLTSFISFSFIVRIPSIFIYFKSAKNKGHGEAIIKILKIEIIAFLMGVALFLLGSIIIILKK